MLSVTCTQCNAHYTMSEELYRRKGGGQAVIVTCKRCKAEIRFDAASVAQQKTTHRSLPKPKVPVSKALESTEDESGPFVALSAGFFGPEMSAGSSGPPGREYPKLPEIESSLDSAAVQPIHVSSPAATRPAVAPKPASPRNGPAPELLRDDEALSVRSTDVLDESVTVPLVAPKPHGTGTIRRFPAPPPPRRKGEGEHEPVPPPRRTVDEEIEPAPPSSSGTPTLTTLMGESTASNAPKLPSNKPDDFLLSLSASPQGVLGPPTIDLSSIAPPVEQPESEPPPSESRSESEPPPSTLGSVAPAAKKDAERDRGRAKKKRRAGSGAPSARPSAEPKRNRPSNASVPVAKSAVTDQREGPRRSPGLFIGVAVLVALGIGAVVFKSPKKEQAVAQSEAPPPIVPAAPVQPTAEPTPEPVATATAAPEPSPPSLEKKDKPAEAKPTEPKPAEAKPTEAEAKPSPKEPVAATAKPEEKPAEAAAPEPAAEPAVAQHGPFQADAAKAALAEAAAQAVACRKGDDPAGSAAVIITFAPSGRVTSATLSGPPFAGTATGGCIASTMRRAKVPPFDGDKITVSKTIYVQ